MAARWIAFNYSAGGKVLINTDLVQKAEPYTYAGADGTKLFFGGSLIDDTVVIADKFETVVVWLGASHVDPPEV